MCFLLNFGRLLVCKTYNILIMSTSSFDESISSDKDDSDIDFIRGYEIEGQQAADLPPMTDTTKKLFPMLMILLLMKNGQNNMKKKLRRRNSFSNNIRID